MLFTGEYEHTIDAKQRMAIPAEIRAELERAGHGGSFYLSPGGNGFLWIWPGRAFEEMAAVLEKSLLPAEEMMAFEELLFSQSMKMEMDKTGRVRLSERLLAQFGLGERVVILGIKDHLELRDPTAWEAARQETWTTQRQIIIRARDALRQQVSGGEESSP